jgi:hypothetical protein
VPIDEHKTTSAKTTKTSPSAPQQNHEDLKREGKQEITRAGTPSFVGVSSPTTLGLWQLLLLLLPFVTFFSVDAFHTHFNSLVLILARGQLQE